MHFMHQEVPLARIPRPNCVHLDNWSGCRVHKAPSWILWLFPKYRPDCILMTGFQPRDGELECPDQEERPRPPSPRSQSAAQRPPPPSNDH
jgi:hypothetical protein